MKSSKNKSQDPRMPLIIVGSLVGLAVVIVIASSTLNSKSMVLNTNTRAESRGWGSNGNYDNGNSPNRAQATIYDGNNMKIGMVRLSERNNLVEVEAHISKGLTPGFHGFHIHTVGACVAPFTTAGGHYNPATLTHSAHAGDLPILLAKNDGSADMDITTDRFHIADLLDTDGSAFIIHAGPDNFGNIPARYTPAADATTLATGDAGVRFGCGVIEKTNFDN